MYNRGGQQWSRRCDFQAIRYVSSRFSSTKCHECIPSKDCSARIRVERPRCPTVLSSIPSIADHDPSLYYSQYRRSVKNQRHSYFAAILLACSPLEVGLRCGGTHSVPLINRVPSSLSPVLHVSDLRQSSSRDSEHLQNLVPYPHPCRRAGRGGRDAQQA
jgi:hypothetical protein